MEFILLFYPISLSKNAGIITVVKKKTENIPAKDFILHFLFNPILYMSDTESKFQIFDEDSFKITDKGLYMLKCSKFYVYDGVNFFLPHPLLPSNQTYTTGESYKKWEKH